MDWVLLCTPGAPQRWGEGFPGQKQEQTTTYHFLLAGGSRWVPYEDYTQYMSQLRPAWEPCWLRTHGASLAELH